MNIYKNMPNGHSEVRDLEIDFCIEQTMPSYSNEVDAKIEGGAKMKVVHHNISCISQMREMDVKEKKCLFDCYDSSDDESGFGQNQDISPETIRDIIFGSGKSSNAFSPEIDLVSTTKDTISIVENIFNAKLETSRGTASDVEPENMDTEISFRHNVNNTCNKESSNVSVNGSLDSPENECSKSNRSVTKYKVYKNESRSKVHAIMQAKQTNSRTNSETAEIDYDEISLRDIDITNSNINIENDYVSNNLDINHGNMSAQLHHFECFEKSAWKMCFSEMYDDWDNEKNIIVELHSEESELYENQNEEQYQRTINEKYQTNLMKDPNECILERRRNGYFDTESNGTTSATKCKSDIQIRLNFNKSDLDKSDDSHLELVEEETDQSEDIKGEETNRNESPCSFVESNHHDDYPESNDIFDYLKLDKRRPSEIQRDMENKSKNKKRRSLRVERLKQIQENAKELLRLKEANAIDECPNDLINESIVPVNNKYISDEMPVLEPAILQNNDSNHKLLHNPIFSKTINKRKYIKDVKDIKTEKYSVHEEHEEFSNIDKPSKFNSNKRNTRTSTDSNTSNVKSIDSSEQSSKHSCTITRTIHDNGFTVGVDMKSDITSPINNKKNLMRKVERPENMKKFSNYQTKRYRIHCKTNGHFLNNFKVTRNIRSMRSHFIINNRFQTINENKRRKCTNVIKKSRYKNMVTRTEKKMLTNNKHTDKIKKIDSVEFFDQFSSKVYCDILQQSSKLRHMLGGMISDDPESCSSTKIEIDDDESVSETQFESQKTTPTKVLDLSGEVKLTKHQKDQKQPYLDSGHESDIDEIGTKYKRQLNCLSDQTSLVKMPRLKKMVKSTDEPDFYTNCHDMHYSDNDPHFDLKSEKLHISSTTINDTADISFCDEISNRKTFAETQSKAPFAVTNNFDQSTAPDLGEPQMKFYEKTCLEQKVIGEPESLNNIGYCSDDVIQSIYTKNRIIVVVKEKSVQFYEHSTGFTFFRSPKFWMLKGVLSRYMPESEKRLEQITNQVTACADMVTAYMELMIKPRKLNSAQKFTAVCDMSAVIYTYDHSKDCASRSVLHLDYPQCSMDNLVFTVLPSDRAIAVGYTCDTSGAPEFTVKKYLMQKHFKGNTDIISLPGVSFNCYNLQAVNADVILGYCDEKVVLWHHGYETILQIISLSKLTLPIVDKSLSTLIVNEITSRCIWAKLDSSCDKENALHLLVHNTTANTLVLLTASGAKWTDLHMMHYFKLPDHLGSIKSITVGHYRVVVALEEGGLSYDFPLLPQQTELDARTNETSVINLQTFDRSTIYPNGDTVVYHKNGTAFPLSIEQL